VTSWPVAERGRSRHLRPRDGGEQRTTAFELFFDLVYIFAITQLSHLVRSSLSPRRLVTVIALGLLGVLGYQLPALALSAGVAAILAGLTVWDRARIQDDASIVQISASPAP
jgi:hypothetical protein